MFKVRFAGSLIALYAVVLFFSSCKDDEPFVKPKLSFAKSTLTVKESDEDLEIEVVLDKPFNEDIVVEYAIKGTAVEKVNASQTSAPDYEILEDYGEVEILKGETTGIIKIDLYSDLQFEDDEVIELEITDVDNENIELTRDDEIEITVQQEDGYFVVLEWGVNQGEDYKDVDMDLFLWAENSSSELVLAIILSAQGSTVSPEFAFLPTAGLGDGTYGLSCNYYSGTQEPMNFQVRFIKIVNNDDVSTITRKATYTLANVNPWDTSKINPLLALTFEKSGNDINTISEITVHPQNSRVATGGGLSPVLEGKKRN